MAMSDDIFIGIGANLPARGYHDAYQTCLAAIQLISQKNALRLKKCSPWYATAPVPAADQPWFVNAVLLVKTKLTPADLLQELHAVEGFFGRQRRVRNEARELDLDLLDYQGMVIGDINGEPGELVLPHPRLQDRAFVLYPLQDLAPHWQHPHSGCSIISLIENLSGNQPVKAYQP